MVGANGVIRDALHSVPFAGGRCVSWTGVGQAGEVSWI